MGKLGKISVIPKTYTNRSSLEFALSQRGMTRSPGTGVIIFPYLEADGTYRTALDENSAMIRRIRDKQLREAKSAAAKALREDLESRTGMQLDGKSKYYHYGYTETINGNTTHYKTVEPYKLIDGEDIFDLTDPWRAITFYWVGVHPRVASSLEAYNNGEYPADTQFYVKDDEREAEIIYSKKKTANDAIIKFNSFSPDKKKKIARLCDLPAYDETREEIVYNMMDEFLKSKDVPTGAFKGQNPIAVFAMYCDLQDNDLYIKDLIEQAFKNQIYRTKQGRVYEGEQEVFKSRDELLEFLLTDKNQDEVLDLEKKLRLKKLANV